MDGLFGRVLSCDAVDCSHCVHTSSSSLCLSFIITSYLPIVKPPLNQCHYMLDRGFGLMTRKSKIVKLKFNEMLILCILLGYKLAVLMSD